MSITTEIQRLQTAKADIKIAIENKGVTVGDGTIDTYAEKISEISGGGSSYNPLEYATELTRTYINSVFPTDYELSIDAPNVNSFSNAVFGQSNLKKIKISGNINNNPVDMERMCYSAKTQTLEEIDFSNFKLNISNMRQAFNGNQSLKRILGTFDLTNCTNATNAFNLCVALEYVRFAKESIFLSILFIHSANLSAETIQSIIDGLADLTGSTAQTLTLHKTVGEKLTDTQKATITSKNWELVY